jgi:hypothetical protein
VTWAIGEKNYSQRRACALVGLHPKTYRHRSKRASDDGLRKRLRELASQRRRFGYRRLGLLLGREGTLIVRCLISSSRVLCVISVACWSSLLTATKRMLGRDIASQIAAASAASFLPRLT